MNPRAIAQLVRTVFSASVLRRCRSGGQGQVDGDVDEDVARRRRPEEVCRRLGVAELGDELADDVVGREVRSAQADVTGVRNDRGSGHARAVVDDRHGDRLGRREGHGAGRHGGCGRAHDAGDGDRRIEVHPERGVEQGLPAVDRHVGRHRTESDRIRVDGSRDHVGAVVDGQVEERRAGRPGRVGVVRHVERQARGDAADAEVHRLGDPEVERGHGAHRLVGRRRGGDGLGDGGLGHGLGGGGGRTDQGDREQRSDGDECTDETDEVSRYSHGNLFHLSQHASLHGAPEESFLWCGA